VILSNQVVCNHCGDSPWSAHRHDFRYCKCEDSDKSVAVDGGMDYLRRVFGKNADYTDLSIELADEHVTGLQDAFTDPERNELGKLCNVVRYLRDEMNINLTDKGDTE
jgi:hypothetical protein